MAIPLVSFVLVPLVLAGTLAVFVAPGLSHAFFGVAASLYEWLWPGLVWAADLDFVAVARNTAAVVVPVCDARGADPVAALAAVTAIVAACAALPLMFVPPRLPEPGTARISVLDAGRGAATLVFTHSHVLLFDTGDSWNTRGARLRQWVMPALDALQRDRVDLLVLPSLDRDRAHAAAALAFERGVRGVLVGGGWPANSLPVRTCTDSEFHWDGIRFQTFAAGAAGAIASCAFRSARTPSC